MLKAKQKYSKQKNVQSGFTLGLREICTIPKRNYSTAAVVISHQETEEIYDCAWQILKIALQQ